jgi:uncharacterized protein YdeI (YjbR/CyaY-like superfamily)
LRLTSRTRTFAGLEEVARAARLGAAARLVRSGRLNKALAKSAKAKMFFDSLSSTNRYAILHRLQEAKKPETRACRLEKFIDMLNKGEKLYP